VTTWVREELRSIEATCEMRKDVAHLSSQCNRARDASVGGGSHY